MSDTKLAIPVPKLRELYGSSPEAKTILDYFRSRVKNSVETATDRLFDVLKQEGAAVDRPSVIAVLRQLEALGCGEYVEGRKGHPSRFRWGVGVGLTQVGRVAAGDEKDFIGFTLDDPAPEEPEADEAMLPHDYRLRPDVVVRVTLPADMTVSEASRFADFIRTLPFEQSAS